MWWKITLIILASIILLLLIVCIVVANILFNKQFKRIKHHGTGLFNALESNADQDWKKVVGELKEYMAHVDELTLEDIYINSFDNLKLHASYYEANTKSNDYLIVVHGYKGNTFQDFMRVTQWMHENTNILYIDLRGHGKSDGKYITFGIYDNLDLVEWEKYLHNRFGQDINLFVMGVSMGCATSLIASDKLNNVQGIIADCGYTSPYEIVKEVGYKLAGKLTNLVLPFLTLTCKIRGHMNLRSVDARESLKHTSIPVLFIHGKTDNFVPCFMGEQNYEACASEKEIHLFENTGHALSIYNHSDEYKELMISFIQKHKK